MRFLAFFLVSSLFFCIGLLIKAEVDFRYRRFNEEDTITMQLKALHGLWHFTLQVPTVKLAWEEKGPQVEIAQESHSALSEPRQQKAKVHVRFWKWSFFYYLWPKVFQILQKLNQVKKHFYQGIHLTSLEFKAEVGFENPAYTALAAGAFWSVIGNSIAKLYKQVQVEVTEPQIMVVPMFQKTGFSCDFHCIFKLRIGHIIFAGLNLLRVFKWGIRG